ncbi:MAG TPA: AAA family ATPase [Vicinamibacteria bacterium]|nr:AAA family ATPase [Vicinamibacteria bacterium]
MHDGSVGVTGAPGDRGAAERDIFVGRRQELRRLDELFDQALRGSGHLVFVSGESGIGKTALVRTFLAVARQRDPSWTYCRARCAAQYGQGEAYLPFLEALGNLLLGPAREVTARLLKEYAPTWCLQLPAAGVSPESLREQTIGATKERMLREFGDLFEAASVQAPLVGLLEDLQWADLSSMDLLRHLANRVARLRMLLLVTFRPSELEVGQAPIRAAVADLLLQRACEELRLGPLSGEEVASYLDLRFSPNAFPPELLAGLERTEGHPFFVTSLVQYLVDQGHIARRGERFELTHSLSAKDFEAPASVRALVHRKLEALGEEERAALQTASVMGREFLSSVVARVLGGDEIAVEERLRRLERVQRLLYAVGEEELPDGSLATRYRFANALYAEILYDDLLGKRRAALHKRAGDELRKAYAAQAPRVAAQLAVHFERGRDFAGASWALSHAAGNAAALYDNAAAAARYDEAIAFADRLPEAERPTLILPLLRKRGAASMAMTRFGEAEKSFARMLQHARHAGDASLECAALAGLCNALFFSHRIEEMAVCAEEAWRAAERSGSAALQLEAMLLVAQLAQEEGDLADCGTLLEDGLAVAKQLGQKPLMLAATALRGVLHYWHGEYPLAEARLAEAHDLAHELHDGFNLLFTTRFLGLARVNLGRISEALGCFREGIEAARRNADRFWLPTLSSHMGFLHRELQDIPAAIEHDREGLRLAQAHGYGEAESGALLNLAIDYTLAGELDRALEFFEESQAVAPKSWFAWLTELRQLSALAGYWLARGDRRRAAEQASRLLPQARRRGALVYVVASHRLNAECALADGDAAAAAAWLEKARATLGSASAPLEAWRVHAVEGRCRAALGDGAGASAAWGRAAALVQAIAETTDEPALRATFLGSPSVREVLNGAGLA